MSKRLPHSEQWHQVCTAAHLCNIIRDNRYRERTIQAIADGCEARYAVDMYHTNHRGMRKTCKTLGISYRVDLSVRTVYALICPITAEIRYVGVSVEPEVRRARHLGSANTKDTPLAAWLRTLAEEPIMLVLQRAGPNEWQDAERYWIRRCLEMGHRLLNIMGVPNDLAIDPTSSPEARRYAAPYSVVDEARAACVTKNWRSVDHQRGFSVPLPATPDEGPA